MNPQRVVVGLALIGVGLLAVGAALFFWQFPHAPDDYGWFGYAGEVEAGDDWSMGWPGVEGDLRLSLAGAAVAGAGFLVVLVPIVAWGVRLGHALGARD